MHDSGKRVFPKKPFAKHEMCEPNATTRSIFEPVERSRHCCDSVIQVVPRKGLLPQVMVGPCIAFQ